MTKRSYHQYCGLAAALDAVGERWALLIVRDLTPGPRRFTDLMAGLPGISTDMLAERLRGLEAAGAVVQERLRHPAPASVYRLTERGRELAGIATQLAQWGSTLLPPAPDDEHRAHPRWALQTMVNAYAGGATPGAYGFRIDDEDLTVDVTDDGANLRYGPADGPLVQVAGPALAFFRLARGSARPRGLKVDGDEAALGRLLAAMPLTVGSGR